MALGFLIGFAAGQASTCAVSAAKEIVFDGRARLLTGFLIAGGVAGLLCLPMAWTVGMRAGLPPETAVGATLLVGALLLAAGALINDACLLGTLARLSQGETRFLAVPVGLAIGYGLITVAGLPPVVLTPNLFAQPTIVGAALILASALMVGLGWLVLSRGKEQRVSGRWGLRTSMLVLGSTGALLFALTPGWTYADAVRQGVLVIGSPTPTPQTVAALLTGAATLAGAIVAGLFSGHFHLQLPTIVPVVRSIIGGALMAIGAAYVPGGNDHLLLWAVPGGSVSGLIAYLLMSAAILLVIFAQRRVSVAREISGRS